MSLSDFLHSTQSILGEEARVNIFFLFLVCLLSLEFIIVFKYNQAYNQTDTGPSKATRESIIF